MLISSTREDYANVSTRNWWSPLNNKQPNCLKCFCAVNLAHKILVKDASKFFWCQFSPEYIISSCDYMTLKGDEEVSSQNMPATCKTYAAAYITYTNVFHTFYCWFIYCWFIAACAILEWCNLSEQLQNCYLNCDTDLAVYEVSKKTKPFPEW